MQYTLLENGADSFKAAYQSLEEYKDQYDGTPHYLKDCIIFLNHGIEILLKYLLKQHSASLMFTDIKKYLKAKQDMKKSGQKDIFEVDSTLKTVSLEEALKRVEYLCDIEIPEELKSVVFYVNKMRNKIMHYGLNLYRDNVLQLIDNLEKCYQQSFSFFDSHITDLSDLIDKSRYTYSVTEYFNDMGEDQAERMREEEYESYLETLVDNDDL